MRDSQTPNSENTTPQNLSTCTVVNEVTVEMILTDLAQGRNKEQIRQKYAYKDETGTVKPFEKWMVDQMFKDPSLRGKKPARKKVLPFTFHGTTVEKTSKPPAENPVITITRENNSVTSTVEVNEDDYADTDEDLWNMGEETNNNSNQSNLN